MDQIADEKCMNAENMRAFSDCFKMAIKNGDMRRISMTPEEADKHWEQQDKRSKMV